MRNVIRQIFIAMILAALAISSVSCQKDSGIQADVYVSDSEKQEWYDALVKLVSNQERPLNDSYDADYQAPRPDEPSIVAGYEMGLFDITGDGVPELLIDLGGGSAGNNFFFVYDIFSGEKLCEIEGGGELTWNVYYDIENAQYVPIGRYDWRSGVAGSMHYVTTIEYDRKDQTYAEKALFYAEYEYDQQIAFDDQGRFAGFDLEIASALYEINGEEKGFQEYHYAMTDFYQQHSLVPNTGLRLYSWSVVAEEKDDDQTRAEKMAKMLLFGSGQEFVKGK